MFIMFICYYIIIIFIVIRSLQLLALWFLEKQQAAFFRLGIYKTEEKNRLVREWLFLWTALYCCTLKVKVVHFQRLRAQTARWCRRGGCCIGPPRWIYAPGCLAPSALETPQNGNRGRPLRSPVSAVSYLRHEGRATRFELQHIQIDRYTK